MQQFCRFTFCSLYFANFQTKAKFKEEYNDHNLAKLQLYLLSVNILLKPIICLSPFSSPPHSPFYLTENCIICVLTFWATNLLSILKPRQYIKKQRHYFANKGLSSQSFGFSSGHVRVELQRKLSTKELMLLNCGVGEDS